MSWSEVKSAINSNLSVPLNERLQTILLDKYHGYDPSKIEIKTLDASGIIFDTPKTLLGFCVRQKYEAFNGDSVVTLKLNESIFRISALAYHVNTCYCCLGMMGCDTSEYITRIYQTHCIGMFGNQYLTTLPVDTSSAKDPVNQGYLHNGFKAVDITDVLKGGDYTYGATNIGQHINANVFIQIPYNGYILDKFEVAMNFHECTAIFTDEYIPLD